MSGRRASERKTRVERDSGGTKTDRDGDAKISGLEVAVGVDAAYTIGSDGATATARLDEPRAGDLVRLADYDAAADDAAVVALSSAGEALELRAFAVPRPCACPSVEVVGALPPDGRAPVTHRGRLVELCPTHVTIDDAADGRRRVLRYSELTYLEAKSRDSDAAGDDDSESSAPVYAVRLGAAVPTKTASLSWPVRALSWSPTVTFATADTVADDRKPGSRRSIVGNASTSKSLRACVTLQAAVTNEGGVRRGQFTLVAEPTRRATTAPYGGRLPRGTLELAAPTRSAEYKRASAQKARGGGGGGGGDGDEENESDGSGDGVAREKLVYELPIRVATLAAGQHRFTLAVFRDVTYTVRHVSQVQLSVSGGGSRRSVARSATGEVLAYARFRAPATLPTANVAIVDSRGTPIAASVTLPYSAAGRTVALPLGASKTVQIKHELASVETAVVVDVKSPPSTSSRTKSDADSAPQKPPQRRKRAQTLTSTVANTDRVRPQTVKVRYAVPYGWTIAHKADWLVSAVRAIGDDLGSSARGDGGGGGDGGDDSTSSDDASGTDRDDGDAERESSRRRREISSSARPVTRPSKTAIETYHHVTSSGYTVQVLPLETLVVTWKFSLQYPQQ